MITAIGPTRVDRSALAKRMLNGECGSQHSSSESAAMPGSERPTSETPSRHRPPVTPFGPPPSLDLVTKSICIPDHFLGTNDLIARDMCL
jgi:hypothetical protein